jgi:hypothetical protein
MFIYIPFAKLLPGNDKTCRVIIKDAVPLKKVGNYTKKENAGYYGTAKNTAILKDSARVSYSYTSLKSI